jgi:hypothetical protein
VPSFATYDLGDPVTLAHTFSADPTTVTLEVRRPSGVWSTVVATKIAPTNYSHTFTPDVSGVWRWRWTGTGPGADVETGALVVRGDVVEAVVTPPTTDLLLDHEAKTAGAHGLPDPTTLVVTADARLGDRRVPVLGSVTDAEVAPANKDGTAATPSMRTLGTGAQQAARGNIAAADLPAPATGGLAAGTVGSQLAALGPHLPASADKVVYVSPRGNDANDGLSMRNAKLTLAAAKTALGGTPGKISMGYGGIPVSAQFNVDQVGMVLEGAGPLLTDLVVTTAIAGDVVRVVDAGRVVVRDFRIAIKAGGSATRGLHITRAAGATQTVNVYNVLVQTEGGGTVTNGIAVGADTAGDVSEISFFACRSQGATNAAWLFGNGTSGNVLGIRCYSCDGRSSAYGVSIQGSHVSWIGGSLLGNTSSDVVLGTPASGPITFQDVRSEGSKRFWECLTNGSVAGTVALRGIRVQSFTDTAGTVIHDAAAHALLMEDCRFRGGPVPVAMIISGLSANPKPFTAINVVTDADNPFGALTNVVPTILNLRKMDPATTKMVSVSTGDAFRVGERLIAKAGIDTRIVATASLPAAAAAMDGHVLIEDAAVGDRNLIIYAGGQRFRIDGGAAF